MLRREALHRIKKADGPAGFLRRAESPYDVFGAGHAGTDERGQPGSVQQGDQQRRYQHRCRVNPEGPELQPSRPC